MNNNYDDIIATLRNNFKRIITLYEKKKEENLNLKTESEDLKKQISDYKKETEDLKYKENNTKLAKIQFFVMRSLQMLLNLLLMFLPILPRE